MPVSKYKLSFHSSINIHAWWAHHVFLYLLKSLLTNNSLSVVCFFLIFFVKKNVTRPTCRKKNKFWKWKIKKIEKNKFWEIKNIEKNGWDKKKKCHIMFSFGSIDTICAQMHLTGHGKPVYKIDTPISHRYGLLYSKSELTQHISINSKS